MNCEETKEWLLSYLDCEADAEQRKSIEAHVSVCPSCRDELEALADTQEQVRRGFRAIAAGASPSPAAWAGIHERLVNADRGTMSILGRARSRSRQIVDRIRSRPAWQKALACTVSAMIIAGLVIGLILAMPASISAVKGWHMVFGGPGIDSGTCVQQTADGGYILVGWTEREWRGTENADVWLIRTDFEGSMLWSRKFGGPDHASGWSLQLTSDGGYILAGRTRSYCSVEEYASGEEEVWLLKADSDGNLLWSETLGRGAGYSVQETSDSGYIVAGATPEGAGNGDICLIKTDFKGNELWCKTFGGPEYDHGCSVQETSDGGYVIAGITYSYGAGKGDAWVIRTDSGGNELWSRTFGGSAHDSAWSIQQTSDGGYIIAGGTGSLEVDGYGPWLVKMDSSGNELWNRTYSKPAGFNSVQQTTDGGYVIVGDISEGEPGRKNVLLVRTDSDGNELWSRIFRGSKGAQSHYVRQTSDGGYIISGDVYNTVNASSDVWLIKTDSSGVVDDAIP